MKRFVSFSNIAWSDYLYWQTQDKKTLKKINFLIESLCRGNLITKAEKLKGSKCSSLRINSKDRMVFRLIDDNIQIVQLKGYYDDK